ncbi:MAG: hypothetical protein HYW25_01685 [Candidatus Aenigmarchaeota archaeon]|nr:hypothetical protein [Candidatus Aenigmarchaeota archaeon]
MRGKNSGGDLSKAQDLVMATVNLIALEEHLAFTALKTGERDFYEIARGVRKIRIQCLRELIGEPKGELWCSSKHTLSAMMRMFEVASKEEGEKCKFYLDFAFDLYKLFWLFREVARGQNDELRSSIRHRGDADEIKAGKTEVKA